MVNLRPAGKITKSPVKIFDPSERSRPGSGVCGPDCVEGLRSEEEEE